MKENVITLLYEDSGCSIRHELLEDMVNCDEVCHTFINMLIGATYSLSVIKKSMQKAINNIEEESKHEE